MEFSKEEIEKINQRFEILLKKSVKSRKKENVELIRGAFDFAYKAHYPVRRKSGEPYIYHPIEVAEIVADELLLGTTSIVTALLHDVVEDTEYTVDDIHRFFGDKVAYMVEGLTKMSGVFDNKSSLQAENFKKMLLSMSDDVRVILIKLADRLHNMRTLDSMPPNKQLKIAGETLFLFAPLAHRLGLYQIKTELEDISFRYRHREEYERLQKKIQETVVKRTNFINKFSLPIAARLTDLGYEFDISGRPKSIYSIWQKMQKKGVPFEQIYDLFAIRIIFQPLPEKGDEKEQCYKIYSMITDIYRPKPDRLRDWVNTPKANGYEALHSTVMGPNGRWVEVQIRTQRMDEIAERGYAAHWKYKGQHDKENELDRWLAKIRETLDSPNSDALEILDNIKLNLYTAEIMVFTPKGDLRKLPHGSTALDFAYDIHTEIGNQALYAEINHKRMPMTAKLKSGDQIRVITSAKAKPEESWIHEVNTPRAKSGIQTYFRRERKKVIDKGKQIYLELLKNQNVKVSESLITKLNNKLGIRNKSDLFYGLGSGTLSGTDIKKVLRSRRAPKWIKFWALKSEPQSTNNDKFEFDRKKTLTISDVDVQSHFNIASCCQPIPGDPVMGYQDDEGIVHIHKSTCPQAVKLSSSFGDRIVKVTWTSHRAMAFLANIKMEGIDSPGVVHKVTGVISKELQANMKTIHFETSDGVFYGSIEIYVYDREGLDKLIGDLKAIKGMGKVYREHERADENKKVQKG